MNWKDFRVAIREREEDILVARSAYTMAFYGDTAVNQFGMEIVKQWLQLLSGKTDAYFIDLDAHQFRKITPRVLARLEKALEKLDKEMQRYMFKDGPGLSVQDHALELALGPSPKGAKRVNLAFPIDYPEAKGPGEIIRLFTDWVDRFPFKHGSAGYGFDYGWSELEVEARPRMFALARRYLGFDLRDRSTETLLRERFKGPGWLTFIEHELLESLGGVPRIDATLTPDVQRISSRRGVILRAGNLPPIGDINRGAEDLGPLRQVNRFIAPRRLNDWVDSAVFRADELNANEWFSRLEK